MVICRYLITLESHISEYSNEIKSFFNLSLNKEREVFGSSNQLLTEEIIKKLMKLKEYLKDQIVLGLIPQKMLGVARSFINDFDQLKSDQNIPKAEK